MILSYVDQALTRGSHLTSVGFPFNLSMIELLAYIFGRAC
jgi:hypothetical protein